MVGVLPVCARFRALYKHTGVLLILYISPLIFKGGEAPALVVFICLVVYSVNWVSVVSVSRPEVPWFFCRVRSSAGLGMLMM